MEESDFGLLLEHLSAQEQRIGRVLERAPLDGRGSMFVALSRLHLEGAEMLRELLRTQHESAHDQRAKAAIVRKAIRLRQSLEDLHVWVVHFGDDVGRTDVPVGLMYLVDALLGVMADEPSDALFHIDDNYMYSVISPVRPMAELFETRMVSYEEAVQPVILNLPGSDPANVLLAPILAHEVGHPAVVDRQLLDAFDKLVDKAAIQPTWDECLRMGVDSAALQEVFSRWICELICDAFAVALTGPSMLFASLAFLPGPMAGRFGDSHPDPAHRIAMTLSCLNRSGWSDWLTSNTPEVVAWSQNLANSTVDSDVEPVLVKLSEAIPMCLDAVWGVIEPVVDGHVFTPEDFVPVQDLVAPLIDHQVPPVEADGVPLTPWQIVLAFWVHAISSRRGNVDALGSAINDRAHNAFALKTIELSSVLRLWSER